MREQAVSRTRSLLRARDALDSRFAESLDVPYLASTVGLSASHFSREFKKAFGETPHQYLYRRRIERAATLLRSTQMPVTEVALAVGYESLGTFTRTFTRLMGRPPLEHRALGPLPQAPGCWLMAATRPAAWSSMRRGVTSSFERSAFGEAALWRGDLA